MHYDPILNASNTAENGGFSEDEQRELLVIFLHVITRVKHEMLKVWWKDMVHRDKVKLMELLALCVEAVSYPGKANLDPGRKEISSKKLSIALGYEQGGVGRAAMANRGKGGLRQSRAAVQSGRTIHRIIHTFPKNRCSRKEMALLPKNRFL